MKNHECSGCDNEECQDCCDHEYDPDEGYMCLNCGKNGYEEACDRAEFMEDLRRDR